MLGLLLLSDSVFVISSALRRPIAIALILASLLTRKLPVTGYSSLGLDDSFSVMILYYIALQQQHQYSSILQLNKNNHVGQ